MPEELEEVSWEIDGVDITDYVVADDGLDDMATTDSTSSPRTDDGTYAGRLHLGERAVTLELDLAAADADALAVLKDSLRAALAPPVDRWTPKVLRWRRDGEVAKRLWYRPDGKPLAMPGNVANLVHLRPTARLAVVAHDPVVYADEVTETEFTVEAGGYDEQTVDNMGTLAALSPGAWSLTITAGTGGCVRPYIVHGDHPGERVQFLNSMTSGQVLTVASTRVSTLGSSQLSSSIRGANNAPVPGWPILRPGEQPIRVGCRSGALTATLSYRSTWS